MVTLLLPAFSYRVRRGVCVVCRLEVKKEEGTRARRGSASIQRHNVFTRYRSDTLDDWGIICFTTELRRFISPPKHSDRFRGPSNFLFNRFFLGGEGGGISPEWSGRGLSLTTYTEVQNEYRGILHMPLWYAKARLFFYPTTPKMWTILKLCLLACVTLLFTDSA